MLANETTIDNNDCVTPFRLMGTVEYNSLIVTPNQHSAIIYSINKLIQAIIGLEVKIKHVHAGIASKQLNAAIQSCDIFRFCTFMFAFKFKFD